LDVHDEFGFSSAVAMQANYLMMNVLHPNVPEPSLALMSTPFPINGKPGFMSPKGDDFSFDQELLTRGQHYFAQLFSSGPVPAGQSVVVTVGTRSVDFGSVNDMQQGPAPTKLDRFGLEDGTRPAVLYRDRRIAMKKPRFTEQQIAVALRQAEQGTAAAEVCRKLGVSEATFYAWKKRYAGMGIAELRRVRQLEEENRRLKQVVADLTLDKQMLQEVLQKKV